MFAERLASFLSARENTVAVSLPADPAARHAAVRAATHDLFVVSLSTNDQVQAWQLTSVFFEASPSAALITVTDSEQPVVIPPELLPRMAGTVDRNASLWELWNAAEAAFEHVTSRADQTQGSSRASRSLSSREASVLRLIGSGLTNREIADQLGLSTLTIRTHRKRIASKLHTAGPDLVRLARLASSTSPGCDGSGGVR